MIWVIIITGNTKTSCIFSEESLSSYSSLLNKLTTKFEELVKSWLMTIPFSHQKSFSSMLVNPCLIRLPKRSVGVTEVNLITGSCSPKS